MYRVGSSLGRISSKCHSKPAQPGNLPLPGRKRPLRQFSNPPPGEGGPPGEGVSPAGVAARSNPPPVVDTPPPNVSTRVSAVADAETGVEEALHKGVSKEELLAHRQARKAKVTEKKKPTMSAGLPAGSVRRLAIVGGAAGGGLLWYFQGEEIKKTSQWRWITRQVNKGTSWIGVNLAELARPFTEPSASKLLPDWPYAGMPPDAYQPPTLVLGLEGVLVGTTWDSKYGLRFAVRPGAHKFLRDMVDYYELVMFTGGPSSLDDVAGKLDPMQYVDGKEAGCYMPFRLYRDATTWRNGMHVKDLSKLNRPLSKVVIVDDDPSKFQFQPDNGIVVPTFQPRHPDAPHPTEEEEHDPNADRTLEQLTPFLQQLARDVQDVRPVLRQYKGKTSRDVVRDFNAMVERANQRQQEEQLRGVGGVLRNKGFNMVAPQRKPPSQTGPEAITAGVVPSSKDLVGRAPTGTIEDLEDEGKSANALGGFLKKRRREGTEQQNHKMQLWHEWSEKQRKEAIAQGRA